MQRIETQLEDDLTGGPADETVMFGLEGRNFEIDLNTKHAQRFRKQLAAFVDHARPVRARRRTMSRTAASRERSHAIRVWAEAEGFEIAEHGRLPASVIAEYERTHSPQPPKGQAARAPGSRRRSLLGQAVHALIVAT